MPFKQFLPFWIGVLGLSWIVFIVVMSCEPIDPSYADELIQDRRGRTVYIVKPSPYSSSQRIVRDRRGRTVYIIKPSLYGGKEITTNRRGSRVDDWLWDDEED